MGDGAQRKSDAEKAAQEAELSARLQSLESRLAQTRAQDDAGKEKGAGSGSDPSALAKAMRLSTEFVAGVLVGAGLGWVFDKVLGTSPWGMILMVPVGFAAGVWNVMRMSGMVKPPGSSDT